MFCISTNTLRRSSRVLRDEFGWEDVVIFLMCVVMEVFLLILCMFCCFEGCGCKYLLLNVLMARTTLRNIKAVICIAFCRRKLMFGGW